MQPKVDFNQNKRLNLSFSLIILGELSFLVFAGGIYG
jgi:hypothetical protein